jgi:hypothetical protein
MEMVIIILEVKLGEKLMENLDNYLNYLHESKFSGPDPADISIYNIKGKFVLSARTKLGKKLSPWHIILFRNNQFNLFKNGHDMDHVLIATSVISSVNYFPSLSKKIPIFTGEGILETKASLSGAEIYITNIKGIPFLERKNIKLKIKIKSLRNWLLGSILFNKEVTLTFIKTEDNTNHE